MTTATEWASVSPRLYLGPNYRYHWLRRFRHCGGASVQFCKELDQTISVVVWLADGRYKVIGTLPYDGALHRMIAPCAMYAQGSDWRPVLDALQDAYDLWGDDCGTYVPQHDWTSQPQLEIG